MNPFWTQIGTITADNATPLAVGGRDADTVKALSLTVCAFYTPGPGVREVEFRFITPAEGDTWNLNLYAARGLYDHYTKVCLLSLTGGQQVYAVGKVFVDVITIANDAWYGNLPVPERIAANDGANIKNHIARYHIKLMSYSSFVFVSDGIEAGKTLEIEAAEME